MMTADEYMPEMGRQIFRNRYDVIGVGAFVGMRPTHQTRDVFGLSPK